MDTPAMATITERVEAEWERLYPAFLGAIAATAVLWFGPRVFTFMDVEKWKAESLYSSAFNLAAVFTAFLFTFYTIFATVESGFIGRMKRTRAYRYTIGYTLRALWLGGLLIVASVPMILVEPKPVTHHDVWTYLVAAWCGLTVWSLAAFVRAARRFWIFIAAQT